MRGKTNTYFIAFVPYRVHSTGENPGEKSGCDAGYTCPSINTMLFFTLDKREKNFTSASGKCEWKMLSEPKMRSEWKLRTEEEYEANGKCEGFTFRKLSYMKPRYLMKINRRE